MTMSLIGMVAATLFGLGAGHAAGAPLDRYRWAARVFVISAPEAGDPRLAAQRAILAGDGAGLSARDLVVVEAVGNDPEAKRVRASLGMSGSAFSVALVGKDGGAKRVDAAPIPLRLLFDTIDAMPMRRDEMRR